MPVATSSPQADVDPDLLQAAKSYLECRHVRLHPAPKLTEAWDQFYRSYAPLLRRFAFSLHVPRDRVDDCVQQVWVELLGKLPAFDYDPRRGRFCSWLFSIMHSKAMDVHRQGVNHPTESLPAHWEELFDLDADPAAWCERHAEQEAVRHVLAELSRLASACSYQVLYLRWMEGRTVQETAACLSLTPRQVWLREHRMKRQFRRLFNRYPRSARQQDGRP